MQVVFGAYAYPNANEPKGLVGTGSARNKLLSCFVGPPFPPFMAHFSAMTGWHFLEC